MARLTLLTPIPGGPAEFKLGASSVRIGREGDNDLVLDLPSLSRHHALIHVVPEGWWLQDLGSANGSLHNGQRVEKAWLKPGDRLTLGGAELLFSDEATAPPPPPPTPALPPPPPPPRAARRGHTLAWALGCLGLITLLGLGGWLVWRLIRPAATPRARRTETTPLSHGAAQRPRMILPSGLICEPPGIQFLDRPPAPLPSGVEALSVCELGSGEPERLEKAVVVEFPFDPAQLPRGTDLESRLALAHLDPQSGRWILAAAKVDATSHVLRTRTRHLSTWSVVYFTQGWRVHRSRRFNVVYDPLETIVMQGINGRAGLRDAREHAEWLGRNLDMALTSYEEVGFRAPEGDSEEDGRIWTFLGRATSYWGDEAVESQWSAFSGNLLFPSNYDTLRQADHDAAHELFHKIQNLDLNIKSMDLRRWWIEASADYAAARIGLRQGGLDTTMGGAMSPRYLEKSITFSIPGDDGKQPQSFHDYATSHFIDYLVKQGADFKEMWDAVAHPSLGDLGDAVDPLDKYLRGKFGATRGLDSLYREFAKFFLLDPLSPMPRLSNGFFEEVPAQKLTLAAGQRSGRLEGNVEAVHSAQVFAVRAEASKEKGDRRIQVTLAPGTGNGLIISAYKVKTRAKGLLQHDHLAVLGLKPAVADLAPGEMIVVIAANASGSNRGLALDVKDISPEARKNEPPPQPSASRGPRIEICVYVMASYDRSYRGKQAEWASRRWASFELEYPSGGMPISGTGGFRGQRSQRGEEDTVEGKADDRKIHRLVWKGVRHYDSREERWEIELKDIPIEPSENQRGANGLTYMIRAVDDNGRPFPNVPAHVQIKYHEVVFPPDNVKSMLQSVNWQGTTIGNASIKSSMMNQRPFVHVQIWR